MKPVQRNPVRRASDLFPSELASVVDALLLHPSAAVRAAARNATRYPTHVSLDDLAAGIVPKRDDLVEREDFTWGPWSAERCAELQTTVAEEVAAHGDDVEIVIYTPKTKRQRAA